MTIDQLRAYTYSEHATMLLVLLFAGGCSGERSPSDCESLRSSYYAAVQSAAQCDPAAASSCAAYDGVECPTVGVNPDSVAGLNAKLSDFQAAGCALPRHSCPIWVMTPPPYTCQAGGDGIYRCSSACEQMMNGGATCVSQSTGCANVVLDGYCSGASMCCSPY